MLDSAEDMVPVSDVIVHGLGGMEDILEELQRIAAASTRKPDTSGISRKFDNTDEFEALLHRVQCLQANVVLRKLFLYSGVCSVMQEIWIADQTNPDAAANPLKAYSVVHVHHHAAVSHARDVKPHHLEVVDAINARHLAARGTGYQGDNPFFRTYIEPSGRKTLKVFPSDKDWLCKKCGQNNFHYKPSCRGRGANCSGLRPCVAWTWRQQTSLDEGLARILKCADAAFLWPSKTGKSLHRAKEDSSEEEMVYRPGFALEELKQKFDESRKKSAAHSRGCSQCVDRTRLVEIRAPCAYSRI